MYSGRIDTPNPILNITDSNDPNIVSTKNQLILLIEESIKDLKKISTNDAVHSNYYWNKIFELLDTTLSDIKIKNVMDLPKNGEWGYFLIISNIGIKVDIRNIKIEKIDKISYHTYTPYSTIYEKNFNYLTTMDYSFLYNVSEITVRQWIRRGKLGGVVYNGSNWLIPELTIPNNSIKNGNSYEWDFELEEINNKYPFFINQRRVSFIKKNNKYFLRFNENDDFEIDIKEKESIELELIKNKLVKYINKTECVYPI